MGLLKSELRSGLVLLNRGQRLIWLGPMVLVLLVLASVIFFYIWKFLIGFLFSSLIYYLPEDLHGGALILLSALSMFIFACWVFSFIWVDVDNVLWNDENKERIFAKSLPMIKAGFFIFIVLIGQIVIGWLITNAILARFQDDPKILTGWIITAIIFMPLTIRLNYLPIISAFKNKSTATPWKLFTQSTRGQTLKLLIATIPQIVCWFVIYVIYQLTLSSYIQPIIEVVSSSFYPDIKTLSVVVREMISSQTIIALAAFILIAGPVVSLLAIFQTSVVRSLVAAGGSTHFLNAENSKKVSSTGPVETLREEDRYEDLYTIDKEAPSAEEEAEASSFFNPEEENQQSEVQHPVDLSQGLFGTSNLPAPEPTQEYSPPNPEPQTKISNAEEDSAAQTAPELDVNIQEDSSYSAPDQDDEPQAPTFG